MDVLLNRSHDQSHLQAAPSASQHQFEPGRRAGCVDATDDLELRLCDERRQDIPCVAKVSARKMALRRGVDGRR